MYGIASLGAAIGQEDRVRSARGITITLLVLVEVSAAVLVLHTILEGIVGRHGLFLVALGLRVSVASRMCLVRCRMVGGMVIGDGRGEGGCGKEEGGRDDGGLEEGIAKHCFSSTKA